MRQRTILTTLSYATALMVMVVAGTMAAKAQGTNPVKLVKGTITDAKTGGAVDGGRVNVYLGSNTETVTSSKINPKTGAYQMILGPSTEYRFEVVSPRFYIGNFTMRTPDGANYQETVQNFKLDPIPVGITLMSGRLFDPGQAKLLQNTALQNVANQLNKQPSIQVSITLVADMPAAAAAKKPAAKKGKKGAATPVVAETAPAAGANPVEKLLEDRTAALRGYFKAQGISTARLKWEARPTAVTVAKGKSVDNVTIKIASVATESESDD